MRKRCLRMCPPQGGVHVSSHCINLKVKRTLTSLLPSILDTDASDEESEFTSPLLLSSAVVGVSSPSPVPVVA
jgi:hypothetical protein